MSRSEFSRRQPRGRPLRSAGQRLIGCVGRRREAGASTSRSPLCLRLAALALVALVGAWFVPVPGDLGLLHQGASNLATALAVGALIGLALLGGVGCVVFLLRDYIGSARTWPGCVAGKLSVVISLSLIVVGAVLWQSTRPPQRGYGASTVAMNHSVRTAAARRWSSEVTPLIIQLKRPWIDARALETRIIARVPDSRGLRSATLRKQREFEVVLRGLRSLPSSALSPLRRALHSLERIVALRARAFEAYLRALRSNDRPDTRSKRDPAVAHGRELSRRAQKLGAALGLRLFVLNRLFSGA